ncbi:hypothetical protein CIHG_01346 [Coccidioides immitis H538.4]|uniref:Uncharacterized protein n=1 Tax=Coccidioides immitis H538.4 TaxID=396776 RepID=A0A0J8U904_COCIT|nr:hypothetical protein CIHG_01346 [Coccidioides immitis H538.4]
MQCILLFSLSCISARRRRSRGMQPYMGTGWAANMGPWGKPGDQRPAPQYQYQQPPPPQYTSGPYYGGYANNQAPGETSQQQTGIELQQPQHAYRGDGVYEPPSGPPPQKTI